MINGKIVIYRKINPVESDRFKLNYHKVDEIECREDFVVGMKETRDYMKDSTGTSKLDPLLHAIIFDQQEFPLMYGSAVQNHLLWRPFSFE